MNGTALQALRDLSAIDVAFLAAEALTVLLGLAISYIAYRGYRRNGSRPMLFVSAGFLAALGVPPLAAALYVAIPSVPEIGAGLLSQAAQVVGLACILYGLRMDPG